MTQHITARQYVAGAATANEVPEVSEIFHDPIKGCFGVYSGPANGILWYPHVVPGLMNLRETQALSGMAADTHTQNDIKLDFTQSGQMRVIQVSTGTVLASFSPNGAIFSAGATMGSVKFNFQNLLVNSSLMRFRRNVTNTIGPFTTGGAVGRTLVAPNWAIWQSGSAGSLSASLATDLPNNVGGRYSMAVTVGSTLPAACALRTFIHRTDDLIGEVINASVWQKSAPGARHTMRLLNPDGVLATQTVTGTGAWQRVNFTATVPPGSVTNNNFLCFDMMYNPTTTGGIYLFAKPQITLGTGVLPNEKRPGEFESALVDAIYWEGKLDIVINTAYYQQFDLAFMSFLYFEANIPGYTLGGALANVVIDPQGADFQWTNPADATSVKHRALLTAHRTPDLVN